MRQSLIIILLGLSLSIVAQSSTPLSNRYFISQKLVSIFGPSARSIVKDKIISSPNVFGGGCSIMEEVIDKNKINHSSIFACHSSLSENKAPLYSQSLLLRTKLIESACKELIESSQSLQYVTIPSYIYRDKIDQIKYFINKFYSNEDAHNLAQEIITYNKKKESKSLYSTKRQGLHSTALKSLCLSTAWQNHSHSKIEKCYQVFTNTPLPKGHQKLTKLADNDQAALCKGLIVKVKNQFNNPKANKQTKNIIRSFQSFHNSWFSRTMIYMPKDSPALFDLIEFEQPALFVTMSLFNDSWSFKDAITKKVSLKGKRESKQENAYFLTTGTQNLQRYTDKIKLNWPNKQNDEMTTWNPDVLERGTLYGIQEVEKVNILTHFSDDLFFPKYYHEPFNIHQSLGSGLLGSNSYLILNNGKSHGVLSDGGNDLFRVFSKQVIEDLFCRQLPVINSDDAVKYMNHKSKISYAKNKNCMSCHATMDHMASLLRNTQQVINDQNGFGSSHIRSIEATKKLPENYQLYDPVEDYHLTKPRGRFIYRSLNNQFYDKEIKNLSELGIIIGKMDDFYSCAARRYFHFLTGQKVQMNNIRKSTTHSKGKFLYSLGQRLKSHQDLTILIDDIIKSKWF